MAQKIAINRRFGGFSLSPRAVKRLAELNGRECYFFKGGYYKPYTQISIEEEDASEDAPLFYSAFDVSNPNEIREHDDDWYRKHAISSRPEDRSDPKLIQVIEELGERANGRFAALEIVEIPDGVEWEIDEYDGMEHVAEAHRKWS